MYPKAFPSSTHPVLVNVQLAEVWVVEESGGVQIDGTLPPPVSAQRPLWVNKSPELRSWRGGK
ncbi:hypothetical protein E2C01_093689 [Portunus trituberculatus]|uniref:Uncharacterized protein n=1 Tax=Portunus trituberculatus TaxID=210409 RepID=A0A5B7JV39_PORTR|nr:hypothetical protein [Portunus trituberculatus]